MVDRLRQLLAQPMFRWRNKSNSSINAHDEFGYVPYDRTNPQLLFDYQPVIHEQKPLIPNTNLKYVQWINVLYDQRMATTLIGRPAHHVEQILFQGSNIQFMNLASTKSFQKLTVRKRVTMAKKVIKIHNLYQNCQKRYEETNDYFLNFIDEHECSTENLRYLHNFIPTKTWMRNFCIPGNTHMGIESVTSVSILRHTL